MKTLSIKQPWATLIVSHGKDIENRTWATKFRGRFLVHASQGMTRKEYAEAYQFFLESGAGQAPFDFPEYEDLQRGGIIGSVGTADLPYVSLPFGFTGRTSRPRRRQRPGSGASRRPR